MALETFDFKRISFSLCTIISVVCFDMETTEFLVFCEDQDFSWENKKICLIAITTMRC
jgi:hypothetical protein